MAIEFGSKEHEAAIAKTLKAAKSAGKVASIFCKSTCFAVIIEQS
jgi:4-hydroxy-2-oxoheptanedioate aldolase